MFTKERLKDDQNASHIALSNKVQTKKIGWKIRRLWKHPPKRTRARFMFFVGMWKRDSHI